MSIDRFLLVVAALLFVGSAVAAEPTAPGFAQDADDPPVILPVTKRGEVEQDKLTAASMFTHGRLLYQREKFSEALRRYERAYRYDPEAVAILGEIVSLAFEVEHNEEAARYAVLAAEKDPKDALLLRRLAMHLTEQEEYARAAKLYQKSFELQKDADDVTSILLHMEIGRLHFLQEEYKPAAEAFERVRAAIVDPKKFGLSDELYKIVLGNAHGTYTLLGECFLQADRFADSEAMFRKADETKAEPATLAFQLARIREKEGKKDEALAQLDSYFKDHGATSGTEPYEMLGKLLDDPAKLLTRLEGLHKDDPDNVALAFAYARALHQGGKDDQAVPVLMKSIEKEVTAEPAALLVEILHQQKKTSELLTILGKSIGKSASLDALDEAGEKLVADAEMVKALAAEARQRKAQDASKLAPGEALAVALLSIKTKEFDTADEFFALVVEKPPVSKTAVPKAETVITWGLELLEAEQNERAAKVFQLALDKKLAKDRTDALRYFLSSALEMQGKTDEALAAIEKTLTGKKPAARMLARKAWILYHAKRYDEAEKAYQAVLAMWDDDFKTGGVRDAMREARMVLSNIGVHQNRRGEAMEWLEQVLDEYPEDIGAMNDLGYLWAEDGLHLHRALAMLQKAVAAEPDNLAYRDSLGWVYFQLGKYPEAVKELELAADVKEPDGVILDHMADAYHKSGQLDKARPLWERAAKAFEKENETERLKQTRMKLEQNK
jgi:tetratricopeptide (TPR) repeat protein